MIGLFNKQKSTVNTLGEFWDVKHITDEGILYTKDRVGFVFEAEGIDGTFLTSAQLDSLHNIWRTSLQLSAGEEVQIIFRKRVEFAEWVENQLKQSFLAENFYGRKLVLNKLAEQVELMSEDQPRLLSQKIIICFWNNETLNENEAMEKKAVIRALFSSFDLNVKALNKLNIEKEVMASSQDLSSFEQAIPEWQKVDIKASHVTINKDNFRALELKRLPENYTELGMIQSIINLPYPMDICLRLKSKEIQPIISKLEKKRNLLFAKRSNKSAPAPHIESQIVQIDQILRDLADSSESIYDMTMTIGLRFPESLAVFHRKALADIARSGSKMDFSEFDEATLNCFDCYLESIPSFNGKNIRKHTVLASNAIHFLPFFQPSVGDEKPIISFYTRNNNIYGINPIDPQLANYNWLVSGTSGSGKSFFVNSLISQSSSLNPNIFIIDIGGSYNKLTQFLGGKVMSLEPNQGFKLSPFISSKEKSSSEDKLVRQHVYQIFLEMTRMDGKLPSIEVRHVLLECLNTVLAMETLPDHPISYLIELLSKYSTPESQKLIMLLEPWTINSYFGQFLDHNEANVIDNGILTYDLKGLTDFEDLSRVVQLIICANLWAKVRTTDKKRFSWIVLDEVAFSLLKTQPLFVDELVSTIRKYFGGVIVVVQDLEKVISNTAGSSILQNTQSKAILQQRGDPKNYSEVLQLSQIDQWAIDSLMRKKGVFSDIFLIRDQKKAIIRHKPTELEYWLSTTAPEDVKLLDHWIKKSDGSFQKKIIDIADPKKGEIV